MLKYKYYYDVSISHLYVVCKTKNNKSKYVNIENTPHYSFAMNTLYGTPISEKSGYVDYSHYISQNWHPCNEDCFKSLVYSINNHGYDVTNSPILVSKSVWRPLPLNRLDVADGFHRLAILAALGEKKVTVLRVINKTPIWLRLMNMVRRFKWLM